MSKLEQKKEQTMSNAEKAAGRRELLKLINDMIKACQHGTLATEFVLREDGKPAINVRISRDSYKGQ